MHATRTIPPLGALTLVAIVAACTRPVSVTSEPGPMYTLEVVNPMPHEMHVSYTSGDDVTTALGTVPADSTARFIVADPGGTRIEVTAMDTKQTHTVGPMIVQLQAGKITTVTLGGSGG